MMKNNINSFKFLTPENFEQKIFTSYEQMNNKFRKTKNNIAVLRKNRDISKFNHNDNDKQEGKWRCIGINHNDELMLSDENLNSWALIWELKNDSWKVKVSQGHPEFNIRYNVVTSYYYNFLLNNNNNSEEKTPSKKKRKHLNQTNKNSKRKKISKQIKIIKPIIPYVSIIYAKRFLYGILQYRFDQFFNKDSDFESWDSHKIFKKLLKQKIIKNKNKSKNKFNSIDLNSNETKIEIFLNEKQKEIITHFRYCNNNDCKICKLYIPYKDIMIYNKIESFKNFKIMDWLKISSLKFLV